MIKNLSNHELVSKLKSLVNEEKKITLEILKYLQEVEDRRLYALRGFSSLFAFCMSELNYEESATHRRISAMRMMRILPEIEAKIKDGSVNLSTVCQLQTFINKEEKLEQKKLGLEEKKELLSVIENKSQKECEREFAKISPEIVKTQESSRAVTEDLTRITITVTKEMMAEFDEIKSLLSHKNISGYQDLFKEMAFIALKKLRVKEPKATAAEKVIPEEGQEGISAKNVRIENLQKITAVENVKGGRIENPKVTAAGNVKGVRIENPKITSVENVMGVRIENPKITAIADVKTPTLAPLRKYNPVEVKRTVWHRAQGRCQYVDSLTNRKCESRHKLQYDHIVPSAVGGDSTPDNLRLLCATHNRLVAIHFYGDKKMKPFLKL